MAMKDKYKEDKLCSICKRPMFRNSKGIWFCASCDFPDKMPDEEIGRILDR